MEVSEIVEIGEEEEEEEEKSGQPQSHRDVYVAVGKKDFGALKWAVDHAAAGARVFLVHVFPPVNHVPTPVGMLSRSQLSQEQVKIYMAEESNNRRNLLQKYIQFCTDAKVTVDTVLVKSNETAKSILELIPVLNITTLVMGAKRAPFSRRSRKGMGKGEFVHKHAPDSCEVTIVFNGKKVDKPPEVELAPSSPAGSSRRIPESDEPAERKSFDCVCFPRRFS